MRRGWHPFSLLPAGLSLGLLVASQAVFLGASLHRDLRFGRRGEAFELSNYRALFEDGYYLGSLWLSVQVAAATALLVLLLAWPVAYVLARMPPRQANLLIPLAVTASFVTIVIKLLGLLLIFSADGPLNRLLLGTGLLVQPLALFGTVWGVVLGQALYSMAFMLLILFSVLRTIPVALEDAAAIHGAPRWRVFWRVVLPLSLPGVVGGLLVVFNLAMGSFTAAALLGGGKVLTLPVLIQQSAVLQNRYGMAGALSALLLVAVAAVNLVAVLLAARLPAARAAVA